MGRGLLNKSLIVAGVLSLLIGPGVVPAMAVQAHGGSEGLVAHQIGHLLFIIGMGYLLLRSLYLRLNTQGWPYFKGFLAFILSWNLLTFTGHWLNESVDPGKYLKVDGQLAGFTVNGFTDLIFYFSRLDHLLLVPAFVLLLMALKRWRSVP
ncbi:MAG: hypothetical protein KJ950_13720 [Proteobacteria bacterium]|nr:hypothetical protein [Pseudomonadota bacterium]MBU1686068.1 hypothetical protein [Pseudomonadota bacterium]